MKQRKRLGLPAPHPITPVVTVVASESIRENTVLTLMDRVASLPSDHRNVPFADATSRQPPVMAAKELFGDRLQREQDRFDAEAAKVPRDNFVKGIGNLIRKRGL